VAADCDFGTGVLATPPDPDTDSLSLTVGVYLLDLVRIDDAAQGFVADLFVRAVWRDPRLAGASQTPCIVPANQVWTPRLEIVNQRELTAKWNDEVRISPDGTALYRQRYYGMLSFRIDLTDFPFDRQVLPVELVLGEVEDDFSISTDPLTGRAEMLSIPNWAVGSAEAALGSYGVAAAGIELPLFAVRYPAERRSIFYVFKILVPLALIVCMSWSVFWLHPRIIPPRLGLASTGMLTLIAFRLALSGTLPPVAYLTRLDKFVIGSTVIVFAALVEAVATAALADSDQAELAQKINRASRWLFPAALGLSAWIAFA
jgi:hypothetical protein